MAIIKNYLRNISDELVEIRFSAASLAFSTLFSLIPFLIVILAAFQSIGGLEKLYPQVESVVLSYMKEATGNTVTQYIKTTINQVQSRTIGFTGTLFLLFSTFGLFRNIDTAIHRIWKIRPKKPFFRRMWLHSLIIMSVPLLLAGFIGLKSIDVVSKFNQSIESQFWFSTSVAFVLWLIYVAVPDIKVNKTMALISAVFASAALSIVQNSFLWVSLKMFKKNKIYGSLASFPIFMLWLLVVWSIILAGASLCAYMMRPKK